MAPLRPRQVTYRTIGRMVTVFTLNAALITTAVALGAWAVSTGRTPSTQPPGDSSADPVPAAARVNTTYGKLPLSFELNQGQSDRRVEFLARGQGYGLFLTATEAVLSLHPTARHGSRGDAGRAHAPRRRESAPATRGTGIAAWHEQLLHRQRSPAVATRRPQLRQGQVLRRVSRHRSDLLRQSAATGIRHRGGPARRSRVVSRSPSTA